MQNKIELHDSKLKQCYLYQSDYEDEDNEVEAAGNASTKPEGVKTEKPRPRIYEYQRKPGYSAQDKPAKYGSEVRSPELDRMFYPYPDELIEHVYNKHRCK